jgi:tetratricopeptide (TPR) repeat protein
MTLIRLADTRDSKRMYDKRFREWHVFKNVNSDERARAARRAPSSAPLSPPGQEDIDNNFSQEDLRRTLRCARTIQQGGRHAASPSAPPTPVDARAATPPPLYRPARRSISISDLIKPEDDPPGITAPGLPRQAGSPPTPFSPPSTPSITAGSSPRSPAESYQEQDDRTALVVSGSPGPGIDAYREQLQHLFNGPPQSISLDSQTRTMSIITLKLREYYDWQLNNIPEGVLPDEYLGHRSPDESTRYWNTIKDAIYLVKISAGVNSGAGSIEDIDDRPDRRAWSAFSEAGCLAAGAMTTQPFDFLRNLFATLSPINTSARPELRGILLRFLSSEAQTSLSSNHPITQICKVLQQDEGCQEISQRSLQCMLDIFNTRLGRSRAITFKLLDSLATLLRRSGEYHAGLEIITELLKSSRPVFGPNSDQVRSVENELAHFYMLSGEPDMALSHCMSVITRPPTSAAASQEEPTFYQDGIAAHTMEDIAEIHQRRGDLEQCITWLERAASIALVIWGPKSIATSHLIDKMTSLQRQFGKDLLRSATLWEAAIVEKSG